MDATLDADEGEAGRVTPRAEAERPRVTGSKTDGEKFKCMAPGSEVGLGYGLK